jgi:hypothetical protein
MRPKVPLAMTAFMPSIEKDIAQTSTATRQTSQSLQNMLQVCRGDVVYIEHIQSHPFMCALLLGTSKPPIRNIPLTTRGGTQGPSFLSVEEESPHMGCGGGVNTL